MTRPSYCGPAKDSSKGHGRRGCAAAESVPVRLCLRSWTGTTAMSIAHDDLDCKSSTPKLHKTWRAITPQLLDHEVVGFQVQPPKPADPSKPAWFPCMVWQWMIFTAAYKTHEKAIAGQPAVIRRGQLALSTRLLARQANWGHKAARVFLERLEAFRMIKLQSPSKRGQMALNLEGHDLGTPQGTPCTIVTICNYEKYQSAPAAKGTPQGTLRAQELHYTRESSSYRSSKTT